MLTTLKLPLPTVAAVAALCVASYLLAAWTHPAPPLPTASLLLPCNTRQPPAAPRSSSNATALDFSIHHGASDADTAVAGAPARRVPACGARYSEHTPCEGQPWSLRHPRKRLEYRERHCPRRAKQRLRCLVPAPAGYRAPLRWPQSRDAAWYANAPHEELVAEKGVQNWIRREGDVLRFPGGGTMFPHGAGRYVDDITAAGVPVGAVGAVRTALDTGCGVASWGAYLLSRDVLTMSFAPKDTHKAQVLFALERGVPAMLGIMATKRLPYPGRAFDMAHCSRCLIPWNKYNGLYMIEIDRVLRPGGYWILSGPPVNWENHFKGWKRAPEDLSSEQADIEAIAKRLCWTKVQQKGDIAVWQKPINHVSCKADDRNELGTLGFCNASQDPDAGWYVNMEECITPLPEVSGPGDVAGGEVKRWPERLTAPPPRIATGNLVGITVDAFYEDAELWRRRLDRYKSVSNGLAEKGRYRNLLDMNTGLGGFAAALIYDPVWVMNVVPTAADANTLGVIYERGLIGTYQDWCLRSNNTILKSEPDPDDSSNAILNQELGIDGKHSGEPDPDDTTCGAVLESGNKMEVETEQNRNSANMKSEPDPDDHAGDSNVCELRRIEEPVAALCSRLQKAIELLRLQATPSEAASALQTLFKIIKNVIEHPNDTKYRRLRKSNPQFQRSVANYKAAMEVLELIGFCEDVASDEIGRAETYLVLKRNDPGLLWLAKSSLEVSMA